MSSSEPIAVVGMSCLFPDSSSQSEFWELITKGRDAISDIPMTHWRASDYFDPDPKTPDHTYVKRGGFLKPYRFNPLKFGLSPHSIEATDTTQIFGMVSALEALEDAGYADEKAFDRDRVSCILGVTGTLELVIPLGARLGHPIWKKALKKPASMISLQDLSWTILQPPMCLGKKHPFLGFLAMSWRAGLPIV